MITRQTVNGHTYHAVNLIRGARALGRSGVDLKNTSTGPPAELGEAP